jgi:hypothetical protein
MNQGKRYFKFAVTFGTLLSSNPKTITMQKKKIFLFSAALLIAAASLIALLSSASPEKTTNPDKGATCCQKSLSPCEEKDKSSGPGVMIMENLSRQFISISF